MFKKQQNIIFILLLFITLGVINNIEARQSLKINFLPQKENIDYKVMLENLAKLKELQDLQEFISQTNNKSRGISYIIDPETQQIFGKKFYRVRVGINGKFRWEGHYIFYVNTKNLKEFFIEDTIVGDIVIIEVWRVREKKRSKNILINKVFKIYDKDGYTNLRDGKGTKSSIILKIKSGDEINLLDVSDPNWYLIQTKSGKKGYIHKSRIISE